MKYSKYQELFVLSHLRVSLDLTFRHSQMIVSVISYKTRALSCLITVKIRELALIHDCHLILRLHSSSANCLNQMFSSDGSG